jgi:serine/threonine protein kinase
MAKLPNGTIIDERFEILEFLGAGSFGEVYRATQLIFGHHFREVALKLFASNKVNAGNVDDVFADAITLIGLQEEGASGEVARHLVQIYDMGVVRQPEPRAFISMKLVRGGKTLENPIRSFSPHGMPVNLSLRYLRQLLVPLAWMHSLDSPIVHSDLKPDNILLTEQSEVVLTDFGLATRMPVGALGGAISYMAPEKLLGVEAGPASDVYAVGLIWYEMLTGRHLFEEAGLAETAAGDEDGFRRAHQAARKLPMRPPIPTDEPGRLSRLIPAGELNQEFRDHPQLEAMLAGCLAYEQSKRYANCSVMLAQVEKYLRDGTAQAPLAEPRGETGSSPAPGHKTPESYLKDAETLLSGDPHRALDTAGRLLAAWPGLLAGMLMKARCLAALQRFEEANKIWAEARSKAPKDPTVYDAQAEILRAAKKDGLASSARAQANRLRLEADPTRRRY